MSITRAAGTCALCVAVRDATRSAEPFLYNRALLESNSFVVLPSVGPIVAGHVMVVSKDHAGSLASMGATAINEYEILAARMRNAPLLKGSNPLEAEHGSTTEEKAGACVIHTHVHWIPGMGHFISEFRRRLTVRQDACISDFRDSHPYIFVRSGNQEAIFEGQNLPSQTIRRILCELMDRDDSDWTQAPRLDLIEQTVQAWQGHKDEI